MRRQKYNGYCCSKWIWRTEFKSWISLIAFHMVLILLGKTLISLQLWVNSRTDCALWPWYRNLWRKRKTMNSNLSKFAEKLTLCHILLARRGWVNLFIYLSIPVYSYLSISIWSYHIYPTPPLGQDMTQGQFCKRSLTGLNSEFSFSLTSCLTKAEGPSLPYYLPIAGGRIIGFIPFPRVLVLCEMQLV